MSEFSFFHPTKVYFGRDTILKNKEVLRGLGSRCMIVTGKHSARASGALDDMTTVLSELGIEFLVYSSVGQNPLVSSAVSAGELGKAFKVEFIIGIGGGSPLDAARAASVYTTGDYEDDPLEAFTGDWERDPLPLVMVPTTAGTGSEVTPYAVMTVDETGMKKTLSGDKLFAKYAFVDPKYTYSLDEEFTIATGLDALSHNIEVTLTAIPHPFCTAFAEKGAEILTGVFSRLEEKIEFTEEIRHDLMLGSLFGGMAISQVGTAFPHQVGYILSEQMGVPHGQACAVLLPDFLAVCEREIPERTETFYAKLPCGREGLYRMLAKFTDVDVSLTTEQIQNNASRFEGSSNFLRTPGGFSAERAEEIYRRHFVK